jgi:hypothetical protein
METWASVRGWSVIWITVSPETASAVNVTIEGADAGQPGIGPASVTGPIQREVTDNETLGLNATRDSAVSVNPLALP